MRQINTILLSVLALTLPAFTPGLRAQTTATVTTLHSFTGSGTDGAYPVAGLVQGRDGNLYGTTYEGGSGNGGTVFSITPAGILTTLYSFTVSGADGGLPVGGLVQDGDGNFYGTTAGKANVSPNYGTVFSITPAGSLTTLHSFTGTGTDGAQPAAGLVQGRDGNFYGTTSYGGGGNPYGVSGGPGTVFQINSAGVYATLYSFVINGTDGLNPSASLVQGSDGNFYGTTEYGGGSNNRDNGTVFSITSAGILTTLHTFTGTGTDGSSPNGALIQGSDGNLYGTTSHGGSNSAGTVFQITPTGVYATLYSFADTGTNSAYPDAGLVQGSDGNFYGTTAGGGSSGKGTIFSMTPTGVLTTLYSFTSTETGGVNPEAALVQSSDGNFYGTTQAGGSSGYGTVFRLSVMPSAGTLQFAAVSYGTTENAGSVTLTVQRTGGSTGAVSVAYAETDGTAIAGVDYQAMSGTLTWADGDETDKTITIPIIDRSLYSGATVTFSVGLSNATGGATLGTIPTSTVSILDNEAAAPPTITTISPNPVTGSDSVQTITINGSGFASGMTALVAWSTGSATLSDASKIVVDSPTQARIFITTQTDPDNWTVQVTNADGQSSNIFSFQVVAPAVTPPPVTPVPTTPPPVTPAPTTPPPVTPAPTTPPPATPVPTTPPPATPSPTTPPPATPAPTPVITSPLTASGTVGQTFTYRITATNLPQTFSARPVPNGLTVDQDTGAFSGIPTLGGTFNVTLSATGPDQTTATGVLTVTIAQIDSLPTPINAPPVGTFPPSPFDGSLETFLDQNGSLLSSDTLADLLNSIPLLDKLINPGQNSSLKLVAGGTADALTVAVATVNIIQVLGDKVVANALKDALLPWVDLVAPGDSGTFLDGTDVISTLVQAAVDQDDPTAALIAIDTFIFSDLLIPQLREYAKDPPDSNFQEVVVPDTLPTPPALPSTGNAALDAMFTQHMSDSVQSYTMLKAVNASYDRYSGALAAGDSNNAALQLEAMCYYLHAYDQAAQASSGGLMSIVAALPGAGVADIVYDPAPIRTLQVQVNASGLPADIVQTLTQSGLSADQIDMVRTKFLQFDPDSVSGTLFENLSATSALLSQVTSTPTSLVTVATGVPKISSASHQKGSFVVTRMGNLSAALSVQFKVSGSAKQGVDYKALKGSVTIPAGATKAKIKIKPLDGLTGAGTRKLKLTLVAPTDGSYVVGSGTVKLKLVGND